MAHSAGRFIALGLLSSLGFNAYAAATAAAPPHAMLSTTTATPSSATVVSFGTLPALQIATPKPNSRYVPGDFNGDGTSDLLWFNPNLSQVGYWTMTANPAASPTQQVQRTGAQTYNVTPGYFVGAVGDFNNDGYADLVFTSANRDLWLWTNEQHGHWQSTEIGTYPDQWQLVGAGDIDGDGYDDLLWLDPSECKFAYWTMHGAVRTGYKIVDIACGYYPIGIGYYQPSSRLSILWSSSAHDLYVWDSKATGFASYNLTPYFGNIANVWAIGGGYMGAGIGVQTFVPWDDSSVSGEVSGGTYDRIFDVNGNQTGFSPPSGGWGGGGGRLGAAGYIIQGGSAHATGLYAINPLNNSIVTAGLPTNDPYHSGPGGELPGYLNWSFPAGWYVVGAPVNGSSTPPWQ